MTKYELYCDYLAAKRRADNLDRIASKLIRLAENKFSGELKTIEKNWKGDSSGSFVRKGYLLSNELIMEANSLRRTATTIKTVAKRVYDTEVKALEIAKKRSYK